MIKTLFYLTLYSIMHPKNIYVQGKNKIDDTRHVTSNCMKWFCTYEPETVLEVLCFKRNNLLIACHFYK